MFFGNAEARAANRLSQFFAGEKHRLVMRQDFPVGDVEALQARKLLERVVQRLFSSGRLKPIDRKLRVDELVQPSLARRVLLALIHGIASVTGAPYQSKTAESKTSLSTVCFATL